MPLLLLLMGSAMALKMFPIYSGLDQYNSDPSYPYLFNGLLLLDKLSPTHIDHPGTPLQILIAILVYSQWSYLKLIGAINSDVILAVMASPEQFLLFISRVLLALNVFAVFFIGKKIYTETQNIFLSIFCQCSFFTYGIYGPKLLYPAPESLVAFFSLILIAVLSPVIFRPDISAKQQTRIAFFAGAIYGVGLAIKLTFLPMGGLLLLLKGTRNFVIGGTTAICAWLVAILPIIKKLPLFFNWTSNIVAHTGQYGKGEIGLINNSEIMIRMKSLISAYPFFYFAITLFLIFLLYIGLCFIRCKLSSTGALTVLENHFAKVISIFLLVCLTQTFIVLKHFGPHYMFAALPIAFVGTSVLILLVLKQQPSLGYAIKSLVVITTTIMIIYSTYTAFDLLKANRIQRNKSVIQIQTELSKYNNPLVLTSYGCYLPQCALIFGIEYAPGLSKKIPPFLVNYWGFNVFANMFIIDGRGFYPINMIESQLAAKRPIFLVSTIDDFPAFDSFKRELVLTAGDQKLYRITDLKRGK